MINVHSIMRGRIAAAAVGAHVAKNRAQAAGAQKEAANQKEIDDLKAEQQKQIDEIKQQQSKPQQSYPINEESERIFVVSVSNILLALSI